jgi:hypothetical protein
MGRESKSAPGFTAIMTNFSNHCTNSLHLCQMPILSTHITTSLQPQDANTICRRTASNPFWEKLPMLNKISKRKLTQICKRGLTCDVRRTGIRPKPSTRARPKIARRRKWHWRETCTSWCQLFAQRSRSSVIIITSWSLHAQGFAVGESTGDESTHCMVIQRMPTWNSRKRQDRDDELSFENKCSQSIQRNHVLAPVDYWIQRGKHDGTVNTIIERSQRQKMKWSLGHFLKHSKFPEQGRHPILVIRRFTTFVVVRQFCGKIQALRLSRHNPDTKITCWMRSTSRRIKNGKHE